MTGSTTVLSRRTFLRDLGHGAFALTVIGLAGCTRGPAPSADPLTRTFDPLTYVGNLDEIESFWCTQGRPPPPPVQGSDPNHAVPRRWARFGNGSSSGYVLVRGGEATVVDTGQWCVPEVIEG